MVRAVSKMRARELIMQDSFSAEIGGRARVLSEKKDLAPLIARLKNKKVVMLGEASHGTQEFYEWRQLITRELIGNHGFNFLAIEGDWPACEAVDRYIHHKS